MSRFSMLIPDAGGVKNVVAKDMERQLEAQKMMDQLRLRAAQILRVLVSSKEFHQHYICNSSEELLVFCHTSKRIIVIDALTRCPVEQVVNFDSYNFAAHPKFEKKITTYTRTQNKPNPQLSKCRPWDVALSVVLKVEALEADVSRLSNARLLFREYTILKYVWESYLRENMELDEMTGIPMAFDYIEVPNSEFNYDGFNEYKVVDIFGNLIPWKSDNLTTFSYMSMEKVGPSINFLQELMTFTKQRTRTFDLETSFKVFDQLMCRCLQLHRFDVVHNCIEPRNIYFGRSMAFNVVYLVNYSKAIIIDSKERKVAESLMQGDPRYVSHLRVGDSPAFTIQDIEAAFYTLINMIVGGLPWDVFLRSKPGSPTQKDDQQNASNSGELVEYVETLPKVREMKSNFWKAPAGINRVLADLQYMANAEAQTNLAIEIMKDLYSRLRDYFQKMSSIPKVSLTSSLMAPQSPEYQFYMDLRRSVLMFFRFESLSVALSTTTYQRKLDAMVREECENRPAWNISNWCFNAVQMNAPGNRRMSMFPKDAMARTVS